MAVCSVELPSMTHGNNARNQGTECCENANAQYDCHNIHNRTSEKVTDFTIGVLNIQIQPCFFYQVIDSHQISSLFGSNFESYLAAKG